MIKRNSMLIPSDKMDEYIKWYEWRKDKYRLKTNVRLSEKDNNWICDEIIYFDSFQAMKEYVHEKELKVGTYEWEGKMLDPFEPCFIYNDDVDNYNE